MDVLDYGLGQLLRQTRFFQLFERGETDLLHRPEMTDQLLTPLRSDARYIVEHRLRHLLRPQAAVERDGEAVDLVLHTLEQVERART